MVLLPPRGLARTLGRLGMAVALLGGCTNTNVSSPTTTTTTAPTTVQTTTTVAQVDETPPCAAGPQPFVDSGGAGIIEREDSDADTVSGVRWIQYETCDRVTIDFATRSGAPAVSPPGVGPLFIRSAGVLRLQLDPSVTTSTLRDQVIDGGLFLHVYVVRRATGELFVDLHLAGPAAIRVTVAALPARIIVDGVPAGAAYPAPAIVTDELVVIDPVGGALVYPFTVNGYTRLPRTVMQVRLSTGGAEPEFEGEVGSQFDSWGAFTVLVPDGPDGAASMIIGDQIPIAVDLS